MMRVSFLYVFLLSVSLQTGAQSLVHDIILRSVALRESGDAVKALRLVEEALVSADDYRLHLERGEARLFSGNIDGARDSFLRASSLREHSGSYGLARVYASKGNPGMALEYLEENLASGYRVGERTCFTDPCLSRIDNTPEWKRFWEQDRFSYGEALTDEVEYLTGLGRSAEAYRIVTECPDMNLSDPAAEYALALVKYNMGDPAGAISILTGRLSANMHAGKRDWLLASSYLLNGDYRKAQILATKLIDTEVPDASLYLIRARAYSLASDYDKAMKDIEYYLSIYSSDLPALFLAGSVSKSLGNSNAAIVYYNRLLDVSPGNRDAFIMRGRLWSETGMWDNAVSDFGMALDLDPHDGELYFSKGLVLLKQGKTELACYDFRMALRFGNERAPEYINKYCIK